MMRQLVLRRWGGWPLAALGGLLALYLLAPLAYLLPTLWSPDLGTALSDPQAIAALQTSAVTATTATAIMSALGVPLGYALARWRFRGRAALGMAVTVPLVFPPVVSGILLVALLGPDGPLGHLFAQWGLELDSSLIGIVLAQTFVSAPFVVVAARSAFAAVDPTLGEVAATLGAGPLGVFTRVYLPQARAGILAGIALAWLRALGEFGATQIVAYYPHTLPIYISIQFSSASVAATLPLALLALGFSVVVIGVTGWIAAPPWHRTFRPALLPILTDGEGEPAAAMTTDVSQFPILADKEADPMRTQHATQSPLSIRQNGEPDGPVPGSGVGPLCAHIHARAGNFDLAVDLEAPPGVTVVLGPSGAGKSLLLRALAGLITPDGGQICLGDTTLFTAGRNVPPALRRMGYLPQGYALFDHLNVAHNVAFGLHGVPAVERRRRVAAVLAALRIGELAGRSVRAISGGQAQRVALARALAVAPCALLLDEPLSAVDPLLRGELRPQLRALWQSWRIPILLVTHDLADARVLADHLLVLDGGRVVRAGSRDGVLASPGSARAAVLLGQRNITAARVHAIAHHAVAKASVTLDIGGCAVTLDWPDEFPTPSSGDVIDVALKPQWMRLSHVAEPESAAITITDIEPADGVTFAHAVMGDRRLTVALDVTQEGNFAPGDRAHLMISSEAVVILTA